MNCALDADGFLAEVGRVSAAMLFLTSDESAKGENSRLSESERLDLRFASQLLQHAQQLMAKIAEQSRNPNSSWPSARCWCLGSECACEAATE